MNIILFDSHPVRDNLLPFTFTRPIAEIRIGILKISEKWAKRLDATVHFKTETYLSGKYPSSKNGLYINGAICPDEALVLALKNLKDDEVLMQGNLVIGHYESFLEQPKQIKELQYGGTFHMLYQKHDIFVYNGQELRKDFELITAGRSSAGINDKYTALYNEDHIFVEEGAKIKACVLNAEHGPIYIGKDVEIKEGALIRGPFAILDHSMVNLGAKIQGETTIGPHSKVGGEISNSVIFGYSNKVHDGFIGNTVIGEWCNLGADTNTSNLKNNYSDIKVWNYAIHDYEDTNRQFHGLMMGDYSKAAINTMFNTGTVVGVSANIFGGSFPPKHIPSFTWGGSEGLETFKYDLALEAIERVYVRRGLQLDTETRNILWHIFTHA